jgi:membrane associated rhomboid family serine protease
LLRGEGGSLNGVVLAGFVVNLSDYGFDGNVAIISHVVATLAGVLGVRVFDREDKLENRALFR